MTTPGFGRLLGGALREFGRDKCPQKAAALAYFAAFAIAPLLLLTVAITTLVLGGTRAGELTADTERVLGPHLGPAAVEMLANRSVAHGIIGGVLGMIVLLWSASRLFFHMRDFFNAMWDVEPTASRLHPQLGAFVVTLAASTLVVASFCFSLAVSAIAAWVGLPAFTLELLNNLLLWGCTTVALTVLYVKLPDVEIAWNDAVPGAAFVTFLLVIIKSSYSLYLAHIGRTSAVGTAGSPTVFLLTLFFAMQFVLLGMELTKVRARSRKG